MNPTTQLEIVSDGPPPPVIGQLRKLITDAENQAEKAVGAYFKLCSFIRENQISPEHLTKELTQRKYAPSRISEIKTVSYAPEAVFKRYREKVTSFRLALGEARQVTRDKQESLPGIPARGSLLDKLHAAIADVLCEHLPLTGKQTPFKGVTLKLTANNWPVTVKLSKREESK